MAASCDRTAQEPERIEPPASTATQPVAPAVTAPETAADPVSRDFSGFPEPYASADYALGRRTFKLCGSCHTVTAGGRDLVGPNLHGIFGRQAGSKEGFAYSKALSAADFQWTPDRVEHWLANPNDYLPGNNMTFAGVRQENARHAVIAYLMLESGYDAGAASETAD
ncbi:c-type cytochrome [Henriciella litoralis]|uniref:c-type cytochrome n=1 Tax=Henriciella litoralis TaxID=568102 RepID=UPI0018EFB850|nr:c-type cytochrome [Henriciella litoralis]